MHEHLAVYQTKVITMVLAAAQMMDQTGIPNDNVLQLLTEGITSVADHANFDSYAMQELTDNI